MSVKEFKLLYPNVALYNDRARDIFRSVRIKYNKSPEGRAMSSRKMTEYLKDPTVIERNIKTLSEYRKTSVYKESRSRSLSALNKKWWKEDPARMLRNCRPSFRGWRIYRNVKMRSSWEVAFAERMDAIGISWKYEFVHIGLEDHVYTQTFIYLS